MSMPKTVFSRLTKKFAYNGKNPLEASKRMVNNIVQIVGIRNTFGDNHLNNYTIISLLSCFIFCGCFVYVGQFSQMVYFIQVLPDKVRSFQAMNCFSSTCVPLSKFIFMYCSRFRLRVIMDMSREDIQAIPGNSGAHHTMMRVLYKASYVSWLVILNQAFIHFVYLIIPFFMTLLGNGRYLPTTPGAIYGISIKYLSPYYEITFALTCVATMFSAVNQTGYIILFVTLLAHELGHFYAICETLNDIKKIVQNDKGFNPNTNYEYNDDDQIKKDDVKSQTAENQLTLYTNDINKQKRVDEMLRFCVEHHQFLLRYHEKVCELYKSIFGFHFLIMIIVLVTTLQTLNTWSMENTILTGVTAIMPLLVYCFGGEMLISAGQEMSFALYSCGWDGMKVKHARIILLMLCLSQHPLCYTAGMFIMNRETFGNVAQVVYKIYAVFN